MAETMCLQREPANLSKTLKRSNKPLMEKRRRERINSSLEQLKSLVLESMRKDTSQYSKLEKADILEMTVKHLRNVQRQQLALAAAADSTVMNKYRAGFSECAQEVTRYLSQVDGLNAETRSRLMQHLHVCSQRMQMSLPVASPAMAGMPLPPHSGHPHMPTATPYTSLPGAPPSALEEQQQQMEYAAAAAAHFREMQAAVATAAQGSPPPPHTATSYMGSIKIVPIPSSSSSVSSSSSPTHESHLPHQHPQPHPYPPHHEMSPHATAPSQQEAMVYMRAQHTTPPQPHVSEPRGQSTQLKIEIPSTPSPRAQDLQSSTPILKCMSPYPLPKSNSRDLVTIFRLPVQHAITTERVWRPW